MDEVALIRDTTSHYAPVLIAPCHFKIPPDVRPNFFSLRGRRAWRSESGSYVDCSIDRLLAELEEAKNYLQSEGKRIELEMARYTNLAQMTSLTAKIISDAVSQWHPARNQEESNPCEVTVEVSDQLNAFT